MNCPLQYHDGLLDRSGRGVDHAVLKRAGLLVRLLDHPVPLHDVLLGVRPRQMADTNQPRLDTISQGRSNLLKINNPLDALVKVYRN